MLIGMGTRNTSLPLSAAALREVDIFRYASTYLVLARSGVVQSELSTQGQLEKLSSHQCKLVQLDQKITRHGLSKPMKIFDFVEGYRGILRAYIWSDGKRLVIANRRVNSIIAVRVGEREWNKDPFQNFSAYCFSALIRSPFLVFMPSSRLRHFWIPNHFQSHIPCRRLQIQIYFPVYTASVHPVLIFSLTARSPCRFL
jgi:hypothetical protein